MFFNSGWVDYDDRQNYLLDADVGVSTHFQHVETTFSFRTRILDYLWAGLPIVATEGDTFGDLIRAEKLGVAVPDEDVDALVDALDLVLGDADVAAEFRQKCREYAAEQIDLETRILTACDVYDALRSDRVYREAWSHERAMDLLHEESGTAFDPRCVDALERVLAREGVERRTPVPA